YLVARLRGPVCGIALSARIRHGSRGAPKAPERTGTNRCGTLISGVDRADYGGGRISDPRSLAGVVGRDGASLRYVPCRREGRIAGLPYHPESGLEPGRPGPFQFSGKPPRSRPALRLYGDLHHPPVRPGEGTSRPPRPSAARIRRSGKPGEVAIPAPAGATRRGTLRLAEVDDRCRRYLSSAALGTR